MTIDAKEVKHVASLAKLEVDDDKLELFTKKMDQVITMVQQLNEVDTTGVKPIFTATEMKNVMREDVSKKGTERKLLMENVPQSQDGYIKVPAIIDEGEEK